MDCNPPGTSAHGIFQARLLQWVMAISFSWGSSQPRDQTCISCIGRWIFYHLAIWEALVLSHSVVSDILHAPPPTLSQVLVADTITAGRISPSVLKRAVLDCMPQRLKDIIYTYFLSAFMCLS